ASNFASRWRVVDQYDGKLEWSYTDEFGQEHTILNPTGLSATVFESVEDGKRYLAIRGTETSFPALIHDFATDAIDILLLGTTKYQDQYEALSKQVRIWVDDNILPS